MTGAPRRVGDRRYFWSEINDEDPVFPSPYLSRWILRLRFERIIRNLRLCMYTPAQQQADPWIPIRSAYEKFNTYRPRVFRLGAHLCGDESMSSWRGFCAALEDVTVGLPHVTKIARKPRGVGAEIRTMACWENTHYASFGNPRG